MEAPRIPPLEPPYPADVATELARWMPPGSAVEPLALFRTLTLNLPLAEAMLPLGRFLLSRSLGVDTRARELVILRVCARSGCDYEWGVHAVAFGVRAGLDEAQIRASARGDAGNPAWTESDALLIRFVDELHDSGRVSDGLWTSLAERWTREQLLALLVLAGWYHVIAYVANGACVEREAWAIELPVE